MYELMFSCPTTTSCSLPPDNTYVICMASIRFTCSIYMHTWCNVIVTPMVQLYIQVYRIIHEHVVHV